MSIKTKPIEQHPIYDEISVHPKGNIFFILEVFKCSEEGRDSSMDEITNKIMTKVSSNKGSSYGSKVASKVISRRSVTGKVDTILTGDKKSL